MKHLRTLLEWTPEQILGILDLAARMKKVPGNFKNALLGKTLLMVFEKASTRTRLSFEVGMTQLGGHAIFLGRGQSHLAKADLADEAKCMERYVDLIMARVYDHSTIQTFSASVNIPVINALCDRFHPCQILADLLTIQEKLGELSGRKLAYLGDGNNVCNSLIVGCLKMGMRVSVAVPDHRDYRPDSEVLVFARDFGDRFELIYDADRAVQDADVVYTDTWVSMGDEAEKATRLPFFLPFQVTKERLGRAIFMHCLPAYRGLEVTDEVIDCEQSVVFDEAENRLHVQKAVMHRLLLG